MESSNINSCSGIRSSISSSDVNFSDSSSDVDFSDSSSDADFSDSCFGVELELIKAIGNLSGLGIGGINGLIYFILSSFVLIRIRF